MTTTHLIEKYTVAEDTIECVCGWKDETQYFALHQELSAPTKKKPSPNPYEMDEFNGPIVEIDRGITRKIRYANPDLFDYVDNKHKEEVPEIFTRAPVETEEF